MSSFKNFIFWQATKLEIIIKELKFFKFGKAALSLGIFFRSQWFVTNKNFDLLHVHFTHIALPIVSLIEDKIIPKQNLFISVHGYDFVESKIEEYKLRYILIKKHTLCFIANTKYTEGIVELLIPKENIVVLPVSLNSKKFIKTKDIQKKELYFKLLFCGRLIQLKGPDLAIEIINELVNERGLVDIKLNIVGDGEMYPILNDKIRELNLNNNIFLLGSLTQEELLEILMVSDLFLLPGIKDPETNRAETQGLVIQEAQCMEVPVLVSDVGGMKYGLIDSETGFVLEEKDVKGFADKIEILYNDRSLLKKMGENGRKFVVANYDIDVIGIKLINIYKSSLN